MGHASALLAALACCSVVAACAADEQSERRTATSSPSASGGALAPGPAPTATGTPRVNSDAADADELGKIPVVMYHQIIPQPGRDDLTPDQFQSQLQTLYERGFRPVTAADLVAGTIDVPAGLHPVVLTFDDSTISQARIGADGEPLPDTALGMLEAFGHEHPDFAPTATFFINTYPPPFVDDRVIPWLAAHDYEVAAHTRSHANLRALTGDGVQEELGRNVTELEAAAPGYRVTTMAYPFGVRPADRDLALRGQYDGVAYCLEGAFGVDEVAADPPYRRGFDPLWIPRVGTTDAENLLASLALHPEVLFVSDGDPDTIAFGPDRADEFDPAWNANRPC